MFRLLSTVYSLMTTLIWILGCTALRNGLSPAHFCTSKPPQWIQRSGQRNGPNHCELRPYQALHAPNLPGHAGQRTDVWSQLSSMSRKHATIYAEEGTSLQTQNTQNTQNTQRRLDTDSTHRTFRTVSGERIPVTMSYKGFASSSPCHKSMSSRKKTLSTCNAL